jgi:hypothetical protein
MSDEQTTLDVVAPTPEPAPTVPVEAPAEAVQPAAAGEVARVRPPNTLSIDIEVPNGEVADTKTIYFKPLNVVPMGIIRKTRKDPNEQMWAVFEWAMAEDDLALFDEMPLKELQDIQERMAEASEVDLGKSQGS